MALQAAIDKANSYVYGGKGAVEWNTVLSQEELIQMLEDRYCSNEGRAAVEGDANKDEGQGWEERNSDEEMEEEISLEAT